MSAVVSGSRALLGLGRRQQDGVDHVDPPVGGRDRGHDVGTVDRDRVALARRYLDGIVTRDGPQVPIAADCRRTEQACVTGSSAEELRDSLSLMPVMTISLVWGSRSSRKVESSSTILCSAPESLASSP